MKLRTSATKCNIRKRLKETEGLLELVADLFWNRERRDVASVDIRELDSGGQGNEGATKMKMRTAILATALLAVTANYAVAQNTLSPANQARPGEQGDDSSKPNGLQNNAGTGLPAKMGQPGPDSSRTTGSGMTAGDGMAASGGAANGSGLGSRGGSGGHVSGDNTGVATTGRNTNISPASPRKGE
jgi:hypothetical protein